MMDPRIFELLMMVCFISEVTRCEDVRLSLSEESWSAQGCMVAAQAEIARWVEEHPDRECSEMVLCDHQSAEKLID